MTDVRADELTESTRADSRFEAVSTPSINAITRPLTVSQLLDDVPGLAKHLLTEVVARLAPNVTDHSA